jgi:hypothetical protein
MTEFFICYVSNTFNLNWKRFWVHRRRHGHAVDVIAHDFADKVVLSGTR